MRRENSEETNLRKKLVIFGRTRFFFKVDEKTDMKIIGGMTLNKQKTRKF
jgi:hypothetical protein